MLLGVFVRLGHDQHDAAVVARDLGALDVDRRKKVQVQAVLVRLRVCALALSPEDEVAVLVVGVVGELDVGGLAVLCRLRVRLFEGRGRRER